MIKHDRSTSETVVLTCTDCPHWSAIRFGDAEAYTCASNHERENHPEVLKARRAEATWKRRHAADSSSVAPASA
jgi:hypothetical protein